MLDSREASIYVLIFQSRYRVPINRIFVAEDPELVAVQIVGVPYDHHVTIRQPLQGAG